MKKHPKFSSKRFTWGKQLAVAEVSDLGLLAWPALIEVTSTRTKRSLCFIKGNSIMTPAGDDLVAVEYISPGSGVMPIHILND